MKIAQIAPLFESVPPKFYGGTERVVHYLTEELVRQGHEVTLFASGDSTTNARLIATVDRSLRLDPSCRDPLAHQVIQMKKVVDMASGFDILHFHTDFLHFPMTSLLKPPCVTTLHGRLDIPDLQPLYDAFPRENVVAISESQKRPVPQAHWLGTVYHGLPESLHHRGDGNGGYWAFLGRISPEKGVDRAIEIALSAKIRLKIAAKVDKSDALYFKEKISPLLEHPLVEFIGEINEPQKTDFLGKATGLLFPIDWAEPFGMVMIEAMACGTPVLAFDNGSVPEVIEEGVSGMIVHSIAEAVHAVPGVAALPRGAVRHAFEKRFTASRMAGNYVRLYYKVLRNSFGKSTFTDLGNGFAASFSGSNS
ncbi:MAG TPA: glycosyltransferase family 4 protein [Edaphocola sp.]|nr:glycosyltransferase family 4 protein [Edaphocola sp.]